MDIPDFIAPYLFDASHLILVKAENPEKPLAKMQWFRKLHSDMAWMVENEPFEVVLGKNGLACANNLIPLPSGNSEQKKEGDHKTPGGLYTLGYAFGYDLNPVNNISWPYLALNENYFGIDDPNSEFYNCVVDKTLIKNPDWKSAEEMLRPDGLYKWGMILNYNTENTVKGAGSQIFMHIWRGPGIGTEGCIAMPEDKILELLKWINTSAGEAYIYIS